MWLHVPGVASKRQAGTAIYGVVCAVLLRAGNPFDSLDCRYFRSPDGPDQRQMGSASPLSQEPVLTGLKRIRGSLHAFRKTYMSQGLC